MNILMNKHPTNQENIFVLCAERKENVLINMTMPTAQKQDTKVLAKYVDTKQKNSLIILVSLKKKVKMMEKIKSYPIVLLAKIAIIAKL